MITRIYFSPFLITFQIPFSITGLCPEWDEEDAKRSISEAMKMAEDWLEVSQVSMVKKVYNNMCKSLMYSDTLSFQSEYCVDVFSCFLLPFLSFQSEYCVDVFSCFLLPFLLLIIDSNWPSI